MNIVTPHDLPWRDFADVPGVQYKVLRHHESRHGITLLLRFEPGARYPAHRHPAGEEVYVLEGSYEDGGTSHGTGCYVYYEADSVHRPRSRAGCVLLVSLPAHVEPLHEA